MSTDPVPGEDHDDQYDGPATLILDGHPLTVDVRLRGHLEPIDGRFHWWGRVVAGTALDPGTSGARAQLRTPRGAAHGRLSDADPWGRLRITGTGRPPF